MTGLGVPGVPGVGGLLRAVLPAPARDLLPRVVPRSLLPQVEPGRVLVVTGASSGIGRATAVLAASGNHRLVLAARRREVLEEVAEECWRAGAAGVLVVPTDVGDDEQAAALVEAAAAEHGRVDAVLHCAGEVSYGRVEDTEADDFDRVLASNLSGSANVARHAVRVFRTQARGTLVLVGSLLGHVAVPEMSPYVVSKWGVRALARQLHIEVLDLPDVHVCHVSPGSVDTPIYDNAVEDGGAAHRPPPPTITPEQVARAVLDQLAWPRAETQTALTNYPLILGFGLVPWVYDRLVGPGFRALSKQE